MLFRLHGAQASEEEAAAFNCSSNGTISHPAVCSIECAEECWKALKSPCVVDCWRNHGTELLVAVVLPFLGRFLIDWLLGKVKDAASGCAQQCGGKLWRTKLCGNRQPLEKGWAQLTKKEKRAAKQLGWLDQALWDQPHTDSLFDNEWLDLTEKQREAAERLQIPRSDFGPAPPSCLTKARRCCGKYEEAAVSDEETDEDDTAVQIGLASGGIETYLTQAIPSLSVQTATMYTTALVAEGCETVAGMKKLSLEEIKSICTMKTIHLKELEAFRAELHSAADVEAPLLADAVIEAVSRDATESTSLLGFAVADSTSQQPQPEEDTDEEEEAPPEQKPATFTMGDLVNTDPANSTGKWARARAAKGMSQCGAVVRAAGRLVFWHVIQPLLYFIVFAMCSPELFGLQYWLGFLVGIREAAYLLLTLVCVGVNPAFLIVDVGASVKGVGGAGIHLGAAEQRRRLALETVKENGMALGRQSEEQKNDRGVVLAAVSQNGTALQFASHQLKFDREVMLTALDRSGEALRYVSEEMQGGREVVLAAVAQYGMSVKYASEQLKGDREVVLAAVAQHGRALQWASEELQGDHEVVLAAVAQHGRALQYASKELKGDREVVLAAVAQDGKALCYASVELIMDKDVKEMVAAARSAVKDAVSTGTNEQESNDQSLGANEETVPKDEVRIS